MVTMPDGVITVVLADDNLIVRAGVRALLAREPDVEVVGEAADYDELIAAAAEHAAAGRGDRHPHAADVPARGHRRRQGDPQAPPRHGRS